MKITTVKTFGAAGVVTEKDIKSHIADRTHTILKALLSSEQDTCLWATEPAHKLASEIDAALSAVERDPADIKSHIADEAKRIVSGARRNAYGKPEDNFERIARFWQAYFENTDRANVKITAKDVSPLMRLMKEARLCETPDHYDSFVDLVGYSLTGAEVNGVKPGS